MLPTQLYTNMHIYYNADIYALTHLISFSPTLSDIYQQNVTHSLLDHPPKVMKSGIVMHLVNFSHPLSLTHIHRLNPLVQSLSHYSVHRLTHFTTHTRNNQLFNISHLHKHTHIHGLTSKHAHSLSTCSMQWRSYDLSYGCVHAGEASQVGRSGGMPPRKTLDWRRSEIVSGAIWK